MPHVARAKRSFCLLALLLASLVTVCKEWKPPPDDLFGDLLGVRSAGIHDVDLTPYLTLARATIEQDRDSAGALPADLLPGVRVFLLAHLPGKKDVIASGLGKTLAESVMFAASRLELTGPQRELARLQLDVTVAASRDEFEEKIKLNPFEVGAFGYIFAQKGSGVGYILPGEIIYGDRYKTGKKAKLKRKEVLKIIARRAGLVPDVVERWSAYRFETASVVERPSPPRGAVRLQRGMPAPGEHPTYNQMLNACRAAADYLVSVVDSKGRYIYNYKAAHDRNGSSYNMLRHCGTTYALLEAYEEFRDPRYLETAERAIEYAKGRLHPKPEGVETRPEVGDFIHLIDEERGAYSKTGGAGLAIIAMTKHAALTGSAENLEAMRGLARYLMHRQEPSGHFFSYFKYRPDKDIPDKEVLYYPGESMLGLLRLYALDPDPRWLETTKKAADFLIYTRDVERTEANIDHDHWLSMALNELYRITREPVYADHAFKIARAIMRKQKNIEDAPAPDFVGSFYKTPYTTPASVRLEAYAADIALSRFMGRSDKVLLESALDLARFVHAQQFDETNSFFLPSPDKAIGGVRESVLNNDIRIDYVQHALSGMLGLARALRDPEFGKTGVPAVMPVKQLKRNEAE